jgi:hypothetical protein
MLDVEMHARDRRDRIIGRKAQIETDLASRQILETQIVGIARLVEANPMTPFFQSRHDALPIVGQAAGPIEIDILGMTLP